MVSEEVEGTCPAHALSVASRGPGYVKGRGQSEHSFDTGPTQHKPQEPTEVTESHPAQYGEDALLYKHRWETGYTQVMELQLSHSLCTKIQPHCTAALNVRSKL